MWAKCEGYPLHKIYFITHAYKHIDLLSEVKGSEYRIHRVHTKIEANTLLHFMSKFWAVLCAHGLVNGHHSRSKKDPAAKLGVSVLR